jgi:hypothetical protein
MDCAMNDDHTTAVVQRYLDELGGDSPAEPIVRALLERSVRRLHLLCASLLHRSYPRLTRPPLNLQADELLGAIAERLLKALREARPRTVRQLFASAGLSVVEHRYSAGIHFDCYRRRPWRWLPGRVRRPLIMQGVRLRPHLFGAQHVVRAVRQ